MKSPSTPAPINPVRLLGKTIILFLVFNLIALSYSPDLGQISAYNLLFPGRERFPFGENPQQSYNLSLFNLNAMFKSLALDGTPKTAGEFRIITIGDSSVWGTLLKPDETLAGLLDGRKLNLCGGRVRVYNLGYPSLSLTKDLMILEQALRYQPDLIIWLTTLEAFPRDQQLVSPLVANNPQRVRSLIQQYALNLDPADPALVNPSLLDRTLLGQRRPLMDLIRLQLLGVMWAATGIDQLYPASYQPAATDLTVDQAYHGLTPASFDSQKLAFDLLEAGHRMAGSVPILLVNEPMLVSQGANSDLRYNFFYPRWVYDRYRSQLSQIVQARDWQSLDLWDMIPPGQFTNSAIHLTPGGEEMLANKIQASLPGFCP